MPNIPPINVSITASDRNCIFISRLFAPMAFRNPISPSFQIEVEKNYHSAFERLNESTPEDSKRIEEPQATKYRCIAYNKLCACAPYCFSYKEATKERGKL